MKKLSVLLLLVSLCAVSCKDSIYCWECTLEQVTKITGQPSQTATSTVERCDLTEDEAELVEQQGTNTTTSSSGGITVTIKSTMTCRKGTYSK